jgi:hypothetical protein
MAFMIPVTQKFSHQEALEYTFEGDRPIYCDEDGLEPDVSGWYSRLSAPGYLDCTDWTGPFKTGQEAFDYIKELFEVDDNGDELPEEEPTPT